MASKCSAVRVFGVSFIVLLSRNNLFQFDQSFLSKRLCYAGRDRRCKVFTLMRKRMVSFAHPLRLLPSRHHGILHQTFMTSGASASGVTVAQRSANFPSTILH